MPNLRTWPSIDDAIRDLNEDARPVLVKEIAAIIRKAEPFDSPEVMAQKVVDHINGRKDVTSDNDDGA